MGGLKSSSMNSNGDNMWKFYSEDSPGVKVNSNITMMDFILSAKLCIQVNVDVLLNISIRLDQFQFWYCL